MLLDEKLFADSKNSPLLDPTSLTLHPAVKELSIKPE